MLDKTVNMKQCRANTSLSVNEAVNDVICLQSIKLHVKLPGNCRQKLCVELATSAG